VNRASATAAKSGLLRVRQLAFIGGLMLLVTAGGCLLLFARRATGRSGLGLSPSPVAGPAKREADKKSAAGKVRRVAPFIVADTTSDSPGTNLETRVVMFSAVVGGTPPIFRQWQVDHGTGFVPVSPAATNDGFRISNAHVTDTGRYALFATNAAGSLRTTPVPLVIVDAED
jgi:hypothetical protein